MQGAAFFDLDRTLLRGATWPHYRRALIEVGLLQDRGAAASGVLFGIFQTFGESYLSMQATRLAARRTRGWPLAALDAAAVAALPHLLEEVHPYASVLIERHHRRGQLVVLATTTPERLAAPLAAALGFDACVATRYGESSGPDGPTFDGRIDGPFVWNRGKLDAVRAWSAANGVSLAQCSAYSDSFFDAPLLEAVGHPTATNPDPRLAMLAVLRGWPVRWLDKPEGVAKICGREAQELARPFLRPAMFPYARFDFSGLEHLERDGGYIVCANHRSYFDPTVLALLMARSGRNCRFLGKREVFDTPLLGHGARLLGGIAVDRGSGRDEPLTAAAEALEAGDVVVIMPQGTIPRGMAFFEPRLRGRRGAARLSRLTGAPVVPVGLWGTEAVWPRNSRRPRFDVLHPPTVSAAVGPAVALTGRSEGLDTERMMDAIAALLPPAARQGRDPSEAELRATFPSRYRGDLGARNPPEASTVAN